MLTQQQIDDMLNASREADEGPTALVRRVEAAVQAAERERAAGFVERINGWWGTREIAAEIRGETQILRA